MSFQNEFLKTENENLRKLLDQLAEARNKEILDLQKSFQEKLRKLKNKKAENISESLIKENQNLKDKLAKTEEEKEKLKKESDELKTNLRKAELAANTLRAEITHIKAQQRKDSIQIPDIDELIGSYEEQLIDLADIVKTKQLEINRLQGIIQQECEERIKLQNALGRR